MNIALHCLWGDRKKIPVDEFFLASFGRSPEANIIIEDGHVSKLHGEFYVDQNRLMLRDIGSSHGTKVNGKSITEHALEVGDIITLGNFKAFLLVENVPVPREILPSINSQKLAKVAVTSTDLSLVDSESMPAVLALKSSPALSALVTETTTDPKAKVIKPWMLIASAVVLILVIIAVFKPQEKTVAPKSLALTQSQFLTIVDQSVQLFREQQYGESIRKCNSTLHTFGQNQVAHILIELNKLWINKGERYENLNWRKVQERCEELLNAHPNSEVAQQLAKDLMLWQKKEEGNMAKMQDALALTQEKKWDLALAKTKELSPDSKFRELFATESNTILDESNHIHENSYKQAAGEQAWAKAIQEIDILQMNNVDFKDLSPLRLRYQRFMADKASLETASQNFGTQQFEAVAPAVAKINDDSPYYQKAQELVQLAELQTHRRNLAQFYNNGEVEKAIAYAKANLPEDTDFVKKASTVLELTTKAQQILTKDYPEDVLPICLDILSTEKNESNFYNQQAQTWYKKWSDPKFMASNYMARGKNALIKDHAEEAVDNYLKAQALDPTQGEQELKDLEKQAWDYYSQAMNFSYKGDNANVRLYLKKASKHVPKNSKLYDRIESYARKNLAN